MKRAVWNRFGRTFYPRYDRRHDISVVEIFELNKCFTLSATWVYGTGNALTLPISRLGCFGAFNAAVYEDRTGW